MVVYMLDKAKKWNGIKNIVYVHILTSAFQKCASQIINFYIHLALVYAYI